MTTPGLSRRSVLAAMAAAPVVAHFQRSSAHAAETVDHLVIGSGYGGSVMAARLCEAGQPVLMLEMGQEWNRPGPDGKVFTRMTRPDARSMWFRDRTIMPLSRFMGVPIDQRIGRGPGVLDRVDFAQMGVYVGRGLGGGSLVNGGMAVAPPRELVAERFTGVDVDAFYRTWLPRAQAGLGVQRHDQGFLDSSEYYQFARTGRRSAEKAGLRVVDVPTVYDVDHLRREAAGQAPGSATQQEVIFGNNHGKRDLTKTYLARARATGLLEVRTLRRARSIERTAQGLWRVELEQILPDGTSRELSPILARRLHLAAGSVGTTELLLRSAALGKLTELPDAVGRGWGANGNVMAGRANHVWDPTGVRQSTIPVHGIDGWTGRPQLERVFAEIAPLPAGLETWVSLYLAVTDNPNRGSFGYDTARDRMTLDWGPSHAEPSVRAAKALLDQVNRANGTVYRTDLFGTGKAFSTNFTYHPLGGAVIGKATDAHGQLLGHEGISVVDGSLVPGVVGVNPFVTITALAEMIADHVVRSA